MTRHNRTSPSPGSQRGIGRVWGVLLGAVALGGAGYAGWTLYTVTTQGPVGGATDGPDGGVDQQDTGIAATATIEGLLASVQQLVRQENFAGAERVLGESVRQYPQDQDLRLAFGDFLLSRQRFSESYDQYAAAIQSGPVAPRVQFTAGTLASLTQRPELAAGHYEMAMRADPGVPEYPLYLASVQMKLNRLTDAKASLALAGRLAPERGEVWGMFAQIALNENKPTIALEQIAKARRLEPNETGWVLMEARIRTRAGDPGRALDLLSGLPQDVLDEPGTLELLGACYGMLGRPADAASRYLDAAERDPKDAALAFEAAQWLERAGERALALEWAARAQGLGHPHAGSWASRLAGADALPSDDQP